MTTPLDGAALDAERMKRVMDAVELRQPGREGRQGRRLQATTETRPEDERRMDFGIFDHPDRYDIRMA